MITERFSTGLESGRVSTIGISALDPAWSKEVKVRGKMLFIIEGLSMYLTAEDSGKLLGVKVPKFKHPDLDTFNKIGIDTNFCFDKQ